MTNLEQGNLGPLTEAEQKAGLAALAKLRVLREELLRRREGVLFPNTTEELDKLRENRTEQQE